jgi:hypothetical protein
MLSILTARMGPSDLIRSPVNGETSWLTGLVLALGLGVVGVVGDRSVVVLPQPLAARPIPTAAVIEAAMTVVVRIHLMLR